MATNVSPGYIAAEEKFRTATTDEERLAALREMLSTVPKHKASEKLQADLKHRISVMARSIQAKPPAKTTDLFHVPRSGAGQVVLLGLPNSGKSSLVATTTNAPAKVAPYPYTTALPMPGMWHFEDVPIQLVDTPPVTAEHIPGGLLGTVRSADVVGLVVDATGDPLEESEALLTLLTGRGLELATVPNNELDPSVPNKMSGLIIANKCDAAPAENIQTLRELYAGRLEVVPVSAASGEGLPDLLNRLWQLLALIRVYTKEPGKPVDKEKPYTLPVGSTLENLAHEIHRDLPAKMKFARVWGDGRFAGAQINRNETLRDKDVVEIHS